MKIIAQKDNHYTLRLDSSEEFIKAMQDFCTQKAIQNGWFSALGSTWELELAYYDLDDKKYKKLDFEEFLEIVNITGNISLKDDKVFCHAHGVFGRHDMSTLGGHINRCVISATCEVRFEAGEGSMKRAFDEQSGLHILE